MAYRLMGVVVSVAKLILFVVVICSPAYGAYKPGAMTNPMDSAGDMIVGGASGATAKLDSGTSGYVLESAGAASPTWSNVIGPSTGLGITGTNTNDSAGAGVVGEIISSTLGSGSATGLTSTVVKNVTSISLTAGDWDVFGQVGYILSGATVTFYLNGPSTVSGAVPSEENAQTFNGVSITGDFRTAYPVARFSVASTTTVYLVAQANFAAGTVSAFGRISARRVR